MAYKRAQEAVEDAIIPFLIDCLFLSLVDQQPALKSKVEKARRLLAPDIHDNASHSKAVLRRIDRVGNKVLKHMAGWELRKSHMVISKLGAALVQEQAVALSPGTKEVIKDISGEIKKGYEHDEGIILQDKSASKHVPKVLKILQDEGLF